MAPPLPSRIRSTISSHRRVSWFLLATLFPFFLPFLILCMPILLLFLAPVSVFLFSLFLLYKVKVFLHRKLKDFRGCADKSVGYQTRRQIAAAEGINIHKGVEGRNVQSVESYMHDEEKDEVDACMLPSRVCEFEEEKAGLPEEHFALQEGRAEDKIEERQLEQGPSVGEDRERSRQEGSPEFEEPKESDVQNVELPAFFEAHDEEGLQRHERERDFTEGAVEDTGKELLQKDRMQDDKQEEEEATQESIYLKDEQKQAERESDFTEGTLESTGKELPQKDRMQDDKQEEEEATQESIDFRDQQKQPERESDKQEEEEEEATQESIHLKDQQKQPERESDFTEGISEYMGRELPQKDRMEDDKQEEEEATQESIYLKDEQRQPEREHDFTEGTVEHMGKELPHIDRMEDDKQEEEEATQESTYLKDDQRQPEREHDFTEGTIEHMGKELPHIDRMEDDKQEEEEATQESIDLKDKKRHPERESEFTEGTLEDTRKELPHIGRMEDDKQEEEETTQESTDLKNKQRQPERESEFTEGTLEDVGKERPQKDRMEDSKQEEEEAIQESIDWKDEQEQPSLYVDATSSHTSEEFSSLTDERQSFDKPYSGDHQSSIPVDWQGPESTDDFSEKQGSSPVHQFEEALSRFPSIEAEPAAFPEQIIEKPREELSEQFAIDTPATFEHTREEPELSSTPASHEHTGEEPELSSKEDSSPEILDKKGRLDKQEDIIFPAEPFEKETLEGEPSYRLPESHGQLRREPFAEETKDDEQPQTGKPAKDLATSFEAEAASEREEGYPSEATSSVVSSPHESHEGIGFQDRIREEQEIVADIKTIKKIVGYQGEPHASILEQIRALYLFLGMEPYDWAAEVDDLERVQAEIELLKVVVGIK